MKEDMTRGCQPCLEHMYKICDKHSFQLAHYSKYVRAGMPAHYIREFSSKETVEKICREYYLDKGTFSDPFNGYGKLFTPYIQNLSEAVLRDGLSFVFFSANGAGKTHTALHIMYEALSTDLTGQYVTFKDLINLYNRSEFARESESVSFFREVMDTDLLVIDEVGKESSVTDNLVGAFEGIVKYRTGISRPTILIMNIPFDNPKEGFFARYGNSVYNALFQNYRIINFSKDGNFRTHFKKKWDI
jgi:hypothetical protein